MAHKVLPFSDQQFGGTVGGPILHNKLYFFFAYEGERQPNTIFDTPTGFNGISYSFPTEIRSNSYLLRGDWQISNAHRLSVRGTGYTWSNPFNNVTGTASPTRATDSTRTTYAVLATRTWTIAPSLVNEVKGGLNHFDCANVPLVQSQEYRFQAITIGGPYNYPRHFVQNTQQYRDDLFWLKGSHSVKTGAEYLHTRYTGLFQQNIRGTVLSFSADPTNFAAIFPVWNDPSTWNINIFDPSLHLKSGLATPHYNDNLLFAPRIGFIIDPTGSRKTIIRGGAGLFYADIQANQTIDQQIFNGETSLQPSIQAKVGSPINLAAPFGSVTGDAFLSGAVPVSTQAIQPLGPDVRTPYSLQMSRGVQSQLSKDWVVSADYIHWRVYHDWIRQDTNLFYNPATGYNLNPSTAGRPNSKYTNIQTFTTPDAAGSIFDALQIGIQRRFSERISAAAAYTLSRLKDSTIGPFYYANNQFNIADEWANSPDDQRNTLTLSGSYLWKWGVQLSGSFHCGSGQAFQVSGGSNPFGATVTANRLIAATAKTYIDPQFIKPSNVHGYNIIDRDFYYGHSIQRVDLRLSSKHSTFLIIRISERTT